ncbi:hypothetical protein mistaenkt_133 [Escherichia phage mistaenkt]|uniref:Uncharacterized protein n=1 Tax=Escherichia phage mistaenkt TaxID=2696420 RepID=A0A6B9WVE2_9CAUD|nr:hypothetical protein mistaenkt_133 [Escherichia phage mistaenkt]
MKLKEIVRKAMLDNSTKDEMYKEICDKLNCSRHAAKVLVSSFIWECSEAYMNYVAFESSNLIGDIKIGTEFKEPEMKPSVKVGNLYQIKDFQTGQIVAKGEVESLYSDGTYLIKIFEYAKSYAHLCGIRFLVTKEDLVMSSGDKAYSIPHYEIVR